MSVYASILEWSKGIPAWQRDALRRLVTEGLLGDDDTAELEAICLKSHGFSIQGQDDIVPEPLDKAHLPIADKTGDSVILKSIADVRNVNLVTPTSSLEFGPAGLTIVYGYNGSGKSGYARILKRICRARDGGSAICPNVFEDYDGKPATGTITYSAGETPTEHEWSDGTAAPGELAKVCIFDTGCAEFYVTKENDVAYRPFGLDLFDRLAVVADTLRRKLDERKTSLALRTPQPPPQIAAATELKGVFPVSARTNVAAIDAITPLSSDEVRHLDVLKRSLEQDDPVKKAASLRGRRGLLTRATNRVKSALTVLNPECLANFKEHVSTAIAAREEARLASDLAFNTLLPGTGGQAWKGLWEHARTFAAIAYSGEPFPRVGEGAQCLLCQQALGEDAKSRFLDFEKYVQQEAAKKLEAADNQVSDDLDTVKAVNLTVPEDDVLDELRSHNAALASGYAEFKTAASSVLTTLSEALASNEWSDVSFPAFDTEPITEAAKTLENEERAVLASGDAEQKAITVARIMSLEARKWIDANRSILKDDITRAKSIEAIEKGISSTNTTGISRKSTELTQIHVTDALRKAVERELNGINANHLRITLASHSIKGVTYHRVDMKGRKIDKIGVKEIVSEGEFRAIAIAAFLAELGQSPDRSAIVVDDPVSSLDHLHRERVALRLVEEAKQRQVIVFTHEVLFLRVLIDATEEQGVDLTLRQLTRGSDLVGLVSDDVPWDTQRVKQRIGKLQVILAGLKKTHDDNRDHYELAGRDWYGHLREVWELTVEELVLNGCVQRLRLSVETKKLEKVTDFGLEDYKAVEAGMAKASRWMRGHSKPVGDETPFPGPAELASDFESLKSFADAIRKRRN